MLYFRCGAILSCIFIGSIILLPVSKLYQQVHICSLETENKLWVFEEQDAAVNYRKQTLRLDYTNRSEGKKKASKQSAPLWKAPNYHESETRQCSDAQEINFCSVFNTAITEWKDALTYLTWEQRAMFAGTGEGMVWTGCEHIHCGNQRAVTNQQRFQPAEVE